MYNTNRPLNGIVKGAKPTNELTSVVYVFSCHCGNNYVGHTSQRFHVRRKQHVTKKLKSSILMATISRKVKSSRPPPQQS